MFLLLGVWYACTGELFLFLLSAFVAVQHECAHAFAAAKLGYKLNAVVLMPFGAVIDGDLQDISFKDEIFVAISGPLCNLVTALFFVAVWWFFPTAYAFTDVVCYTSLSIALINLLPAYPLDGGRVLQCALTRLFSHRQPSVKEGERRAKALCRAITLSLALLALLLFGAQLLQGTPNFTLLAFGAFLLFGGIGNREKAVYERLNFSFAPDLKRGVEVRKIAVLDECELKSTFRFLSRGSYLVLEVFHGEQFSFSLSQNKLAEWFLTADSPYERLGDLWKKEQNKENLQVF